MGNPLTRFPPEVFMSEEEKGIKEEFRYQVDLPEDLKSVLKEGGEGERGSKAEPGETTPGGKELEKRVEELELLVDELTSERDQWKEKYLRALADLENSRKRFQRDSLELRRYGHEVAVREILPVLDNLERAIQASKHAGNLEQLLQGLEMVVRQFYQILSHLGVEPVPARGEPFNPEMHEAFQEVERDDLPANTVVEEIQKGFRLHERLLRPAKVIVAKPRALPLEEAPSEPSAPEDWGSDDARD